MLSSMRKNSKFLNIFLWIVIVAFLSTIFFVWGMGDNQADASYAAKVDDYTISYYEYRDRYEELTNQLRAMFGDQMDAMFASEQDLALTVLNNVIDNRLLLTEARRLNIPVSNNEIAQMITSDPTFMTNNAFDIERYQEILRLSGYTPSAYEARIRDDITVSKLNELIASSVAVTEEEVVKEYEYQNTAYSGSYFIVSAYDYLSDEALPEADLQTYFSANIEKYRQPAQIQMKSIEFNVNDFVYEVSVTDDELLARYNATIGNYTVPESAEISQIVFFVSDWNNTDLVTAAQDKAAAAQREINSGIPFGEVAAKYSDSPGENGDGSLGRISRPEGILDPIDQALFMLEDGEVSPITRSDYGLHIFKAENRQEAVVAPFEEVRDLIYNTMANEAKSTTFRNHIYEIYREIMSAGNITAYMESNPDAFEVTEIPMLAENDQTAFFQREEELKNTLFSLNNADFSPLMDFEGSTYIYEIVDKVNSYLPELEQVRDLVSADYRNHLAYEAAAMDVNTKSSNNETMSAEEFLIMSLLFNNAVITPIYPYKRIDALPNPSWLAELGDEFFTMEEGNFAVFHVRENGMLRVIRLDKIEKPNMDDLQNSRDAIESYILSIKQNDAVAAVLADLRTKHKIVYNQQFVDNLY